MDILDWPTEKLIWYRDKLRQEFDELWEKKEKPLLMRHIGCHLLYVMQIIKEREENEHLEDRTS